MKITRRNFVQVFGSAAAMIVSGGGLTSAFGRAVSKNSLFSSSSKTLFGMKVSDVELLLGHSFTATAADGTRSELVMTEVNNLVRKANSTRGYSGECFSMIFECLGGKNIQQDVYQVASPEMDEVSAMIVPTTRDNREYEIVVNRVTR